MRIAVLHQRVPADAPPDERDVLVEVDAVQAALQRLGHETCAIDCDLDLGALERRLRSFQAELAFNLVESLGGSGRLQHLVPCLLSARGVRFAGSSGEALMLTSHKVMTKRLLALHGVPVPPSHPEADGPYMVKPIAEDASVGIDDRSVVPDEASAARMLEEKGPGWFAEAFVPGREINVALLDGEVLPPAEVFFEGDWGARPRIVGYAAKWEPASFEYRSTVRRIGLDARTHDLVTPIARRSWEALDLSGWARVDLRVTERFDPFVLEVNANPCLSPDAGFAASLEAAGISFDAAIARIVQAGLR
jgi:D-alanine-D-alanine ligase